MKLKFALIHLLMAAAMCVPVWAGNVKLSLEKTGIEIDSGGPEKLILEYPILAALGNDGSEKATFKVMGKKAEAKYPSGAKIEIELSGDDFTCKYSGVPEFMNCLKFSMVIPGSFAGAGKFAVGGNALQDFPEKAGKEQHLVKGTTADKLELVTPGHGGFSMAGKTNWYEMQDNRAMGWGNQFIYSIFYDVKAYPGVSEFKVQFKPYKP